MDYSFEDMSESHRRPVIDIFNYFIKNTHAAYPEKVVDYRFFDLFLTMSRGYPALVIKTASHQVIGFAFMRPYHFTDTFRRTAEITYFILPEHTRKGLGTAILELFIQKAGQMAIDSLLASVSSHNEVSLGFHLKNGFKKCGRFLRVGRKLGEDFDMVWLQRQLSQPQVEGLD
jgi:L-amino acid N-acyltransferase YncA